MTAAKDVERRERRDAPSHEPEQTPFERLAEFARRIVAVPKSEFEKRAREYRRRRNRDKPRKMHKPL